MSMTLNTKLGIGAALIGAFALGVSAIAFSSAEDQPASSAQDEPTQSKAPSRVSTSFSGLQEDEIRALVRDYLLTNPEVIIEAVNEYSSRQRRQSAALAKEGASANLTALLNPKHGYITGKNPKKATVAVIELYDYHCTFCKRAAPLIKDITAQDAAVKIVFRELPILKEESHYAAEISLAARDQKKFLPLHFAMMDAKGTLTKERVHAIAKKQGIDVKKLKSSRTKAEVSNAIIETHRIAADMGIDGTPAFIVAALDGSYVEVVTGFRPEELIEKIEAAKQAAKK
jgi:protein-disulfide isomerase